MQDLRVEPSQFDVAMTPATLNSQPLITVIIPAFNEETTIGAILDRVFSVPASKQVIVVDDGSRDDTAAVVVELRRSELTLIRHETNKGKGAAIRTALPHARGRYTVIQDADLEYDPADYQRLLDPLERRECRVVYGSRYLAAPSNNVRRMNPFRWGVSFLNVCVRALYSVNLTDEATCYKAFDTELLRSLDLQCERFEFCPEVTAKLCRWGERIQEVPISYHPRNKQEGKKIRLADGIQALRELWKWRNWRPDLTH